jgi:hypothetical protein|nr:NotI family restriction endonuclease [Kiritimatiellia bacterium]
VYISGNIRDPFQMYMDTCSSQQDMDWRNQPNYPRPDFLSSSRKRLAPQLFFKGGILNQWRKKMAVAMDSAFYQTLPKLDEVETTDADMAWLIYDLTPNSKNKGYHLEKTKTVYTKFSEALEKITRPRVGRVEDFLHILQRKVDEKLESPPDNQTIESPI